MPLVFSLERQMISYGMLILYQVYAIIYSICDVIIFAVIRAGREYTCTIEVTIHSCLNKIKPYLPTKGQRGLEHTG